MQGPAVPELLAHRPGTLELGLIPCLLGEYDAHACGVGKQAVGFRFINGHRESCMVRGPQRFGDRNRADGCINLAPRNGGGHSWDECWGSCYPVLVQEFQPLCASPTAHCVKVEM